MKPKTEDEELPIMKVKSITRSYTGIYNYNYGSSQ